MDNLLLLDVTRLHRERLLCEFTAFRSGSRLSFVLLRLCNDCRVLCWARLGFRDKIAVAFVIQGLLLHLANLYATSQGVMVTY
jgi:hypothetical protein